MKVAGFIAIGAAAVALAAPAYADDPDIRFADQLHGYGIYGPRDYNAWLGKIVCERLRNHVDNNADQSVTFVSHNLERGSTSTQAWQFVGAAISTYCPDEAPVWDAAAAQHS